MAIKPICVPCWNEKLPNVVGEQHYGEPDTICAFCGAQTNSGIYLREADILSPKVAELRRTLVALRNRKPELEEGSVRRQLLVCSQKHSIVWDVDSSPFPTRCPAWVWNDSQCRAMLHFVGDLVLTKHDP